MTGRGHDTTCGGVSTRTGCEQATHELASMITIGSDGGSGFFIVGQDLGVVLVGARAVSDLGL